MPFGAQILTDGRVRFRLWAPAAERVVLCIEALGGEQRLEMDATEDGWRELLTPRAKAGSRYRFQIDGGLRIPDPASRFQPDDVHGPSEVIDPKAFRWHDAHWAGRPWEEAVLYELHVGTFTLPGTFDGVIERLDYLAELGVTALELMPVAAFPGRFNWGYDGALLFAPDARYGRPEDLKSLVQAAHERGLMVLLDVVYNHFGPEGNYLHHYAPAFFTDRHRTPWGPGIDLAGAHSRVVRDFFIDNALYWLTEYHLDGLRLDAVHALHDDSAHHLLTELAEAVHAGPGRGRHIHLVLENDDNAARHLARRAEGAPRWYVAQWNDDFHHAAHVLVTGETHGYYADYAEAPLAHLGRCLAEGFAYQGERSPFRESLPRGESSAALPPTAFVNFLQTHDQAGNRSFGERLDRLTSPEALRALSTILLLAPAPPLLFMGQEWLAPSPFLFFCDFGDDFGAAVREGRRRDLARFEPLADPSKMAASPDPTAAATFERCRLDWHRLSAPEHWAWHDFHRALLALRRHEITPRLAGSPGGRARFERLDPMGHDRLLRVAWLLGDGSQLILTANLGDQERALPNSARSRAARQVHVEPTSAAPAFAAGRLPRWSVVFEVECRHSGP